ncbi:MAG: hypothetical protein ABRQ38_05365 [Candidatus Eremiobacterota bacterium]
MIAIFPPPVTALIDKANDVYQKRASVKELKEALDYAKNFHEKSRSYFMFFNKSRVEDKEVLRLNEEMLYHCKKLDEAFEKMEEFVKTEKNDLLFEAVIMVQEASYMISENTRALKRIKENFQRFSPMDIIDDFIKIAVNVYNGVFEKTALLEKIPFIVVWKQAIESDVLKFKEKYPEAEELNINMTNSLSYIERGIGAIYTFTEQGDKEDLMNGMRILGVVSGDLQGFLNEMGDYRTKKCKYISNIHADEFLSICYNFIENTGTPEEAKKALYEFKNYFKGIEEEIEKFQKDFMVRLPVKDEFIEDIDRYITEIKNYLAEIDKILTDKEEETQDKECLSGLLKKINEEFDSLQKKKSEFYSKSLQEKDLSGDVEMLQLRDIIKGLYNRIVPVSALQEALIPLCGRASSLLERTDTFLSEKEDERIRAIHRALESRKMAFSELEQYVIDRIEDHLFDALETIEETYDDLVGVEEILSEKETEKNMIACFKCSTMNPKGQKMCSKCGAKLPFASVGNMESTSIEVVMEDGGTSGEGMKYEEIKELRELTDNILQGLRPSEDLRKPLGKIIEKIGENKKAFKEFITPYLEKHSDDKELKCSSDELTKIFNDLDNGTSHMNSYFTKEKRDEYLSEGLEEILKAVK